jgi:hypothetical protein
MRRTPVEADLTDVGGFSHAKLQKIGLAVPIAGEFGVKAHRRANIATWPAAGFSDTRLS